MDHKALLRSWKEISSFLNCSVRSAQRWERHEHLPVERHNHSARQTVWGNRAKLRAWMEAKSRVPLKIKVDGELGHLVRVLRDGELMHEPLLLARALFSDETLREVYRSLGRKKATSLALVDAAQKAPPLRKLSRDGARMSRIGAHA